MKTIPARVAFSAVLFALVTKIGLLYWSSYQLPLLERPGDIWINVWNRWDAQHYLRIASHWYSSEGISRDRFLFLSHFPPFYPMTVTAISFLTRLPIVYAGLLVSNVSGLIAAYLLSRLAWHEFEDSATVVRSNALFHLYPVAYFLICPYSESLFFALTLGFFCALRSNRNGWFLACLAAAAILTRLMAVNVVPVLVARLVIDIRSKRRNPTELFALLLPLAAVAAYLVLNHLVWGEPLYFLRHVYEDRNTPRQPNYPFRETVQVLFEISRQIVQGTLTEKYMEVLGWGAVFTLFASIVTLAGAALKVVPWEYTLYSICFISFYSSFAWGISNARYSFGAFPIFFVLARARPRLLGWIFLVPSVAGLLYFSKLYVWGYWAF